MSNVILPATAQWNAARERMTARHAELQWFDDQLKEFDPLLSLVRAAPHAEDPDLVPGYWHIKRSNAIGMDTYLVLKGPNGEFSEPHSGFIEQLRKEDLQRAGAWEELMARLEREETASARAQQEAREDMKVEFAERYKVHANPGVSMTNQGKGWKNRAKARKGR